MFHQQHIQDEVWAIMQLLVDGEWEQLEARTQGTRLTSDEIARELSEYPATFVMPPPQVLKELDVHEIASRRCGNECAWSVWFSLWSKEEGSSDLGVEIRIVYDGAGYRTELDNIRVP